MKKENILKSYTQEAEKLIRTQQDGDQTEARTNLNRIRCIKADRAKDLYRKLHVISIAEAKEIGEIIEKNRRINKVTSGIHAAVALGKTSEQFFSEINEAFSLIFSDVAIPAEGFKKFLFFQDIAQGAVKAFGEIIRAPNYKVGANPNRWNRVVVALIFYYSAPFAEINFLVEQKVDLVLLDLTSEISAYYRKEVARLNFLYKKLGTHKGTALSKKKDIEYYYKKILAENPRWVESTTRTQRAKAIKEEITNMQTVDERRKNPAPCVKTIMKRLKSLET